MIINLGMNWENFYTNSIVAYVKSLQSNPFELITLILGDKSNFLAWFGIQADVL